jgi:anti-anti-sigma regulatory factor
MVRACYAVQEERAKGVIIDVSAVPTMDTSAVAALGQVAQSVANMGARVVFAGIKAEIAMAMARMGVSFEGGAGTVVDAEAALAVLSDGVRSIGHSQGIRG